ncbi:protein kinase domain-containing protein [Drechmeria coniospora]|uniref:non-specific serine/threonine protein kinase n=1 Tax=Drechmeria coniospora TaxID=98403 RepID=A0A151GE69_DRECN|nr:protein kinase domain-containing protein [Drechmeria coniospora]KYK55373.1 protein kinase domain-containing protein [Drechmeria coniospora]
MTYSPEYKWIDGAEDLERYTKGGYHPVEIGNVLDNRYEIVDKLGYGGWSTVWLGRDSRRKQYVAVKVGIADSLSHEMKALRAPEPSTSSPADGSDAILRVLDEFRVEGPNGSHPCYTTEPALRSLRECSFSRLFPLDVSRALAYELTLAVAHVHSRGYAHGAFNDLSIQQFRKEHGEPLTYPVERVDGNALPPNVPSSAVVPLSMKKEAEIFALSDARLLLGDFGEAFISAAKSRLGADCHTPVDFRPPEARHEPNVPLSFSADIWSLATAIWDILGMQPLFSSAFTSREKVMCQIVDVLGPLPSDWFEKWEAKTEFFDDDGTPKPGRRVWPKLGELFEERVQQFRREDNMDEFGHEETAAILDMMGRMLQPMPEERVTIRQVLECDWMVKWARLDYLQSRKQENR